MTQFLSEALLYPLLTWLEELHSNLEESLVVEDDLQMKKGLKNSKKKKENLINLHYKENVVV